MIPPQVDSPVRRDGMLQFWEVADRAINKGPLMRMKEFDLKIFKVTSRLAKEYRIRYDPKLPIPSDDELADRLFEAGLKLFIEVGVYCVDTERVITFTEEEVRESLVELGRMPDWIEIGDGVEKRRLFKRGIGDPRKPLVVGGVVEDNPVEGRDFVQLYKSIAQERIIDGIYYGPPPRSIEGRKWIIGSPLDCHAAMSAVAWMREALRSVGRPGLHLLDACPSALGTISACNPENGLRRTDALTLPTVSELKVNFEMLNKVAYSLDYGCLRSPFWTSIVGGFAGGPEGCALINVAAALNALMVYQVGGAGYIMNSSILQNPPVNTARQTIWVRNLSMQALVRNTNLICGGGGLTSAGPGTEQQLWEIAALGIHTSCVGGHIFHGARKAVLVKPNQGTGMEPRWEGEAARAGASLSRGEANELIDFILRKYEDKIIPGKAPEGYTFQDLYDYESVTVKPEYFGLYSKVKKELEDKGLKFD
jgi:methylamine--corrinoid protein Co-methyltransferase